MKKLDPSAELATLPADWLNDGDRSPQDRRSIDTATDLSKATEVLNTTLELLTRFPAEALDDTLSLLPVHSEESRTLFHAAVTTIQDLEPDTSKVTAGTIDEALVRLRASYPKFERTSHAALATRCIRWSLSSLVHKLCSDMGRHIPFRWYPAKDEWRAFVDAHSRDFEKLALALEQTQRLGAEDRFSTTFVVGLCTNVLPEDVLVPRLHALVAKAPSWRVRKLVLEELERCNLPMP